MHFNGDIKAHVDLKHLYEWWHSAVGTPHWRQLQWHRKQEVPVIIGLISSTLMIGDTRHLYDHAVNDKNQRHWWQLARPARDNCNGTGSRCATACSCYVSPLKQVQQIAIYFLWSRSNRSQHVLLSLAIGMVRQHGPLHWLCFISSALNVSPAMNVSSVMNVSPAINVSSAIDVSSAINVSWSNIWFTLLQLKFQQ